jgi:hypothetical protein
LAEYRGLPPENPIAIGKLAAVLPKPKARILPAMARRVPLW